MSDQPTKKLYDDMDLRIFTSEGQWQECDQQCDDPISGCIQLKRLVVMLLYYQKLNIEHRQNFQAIFIRFIKDIYTEILDDYAHVVNTHHNLEAISKALKQNKVFGACDVTKCPFTARHQSRHSMNTKVFNISNDHDVFVQFYAQRLDSLHFYLMHLFDCGMRTEQSNAIRIDTNQQAFVADEKDKYFDQEFARVKLQINERKHIRLAIHGDSTNKFSIQTAPAASTDTIFMDETIRYLINSRHCIEEHAIRNVWKFLSEQQHDSDSLKAYFKYGNGLAANNSGNAFEALVQFVKATQLSRSMFNVGFAFYYWAEYETGILEENNDSMNHNDHSGYGMTELIIPRRHNTFKQEIMKYPFVNMEIYTKTIIKVKEYMATKTIKRLSACNYLNLHHFIPLHYGINHGDPLLPRHLAALLLYTDYGKLCTYFSATFRPKTQFEQISSVKSRNSHFWWMSKSLREIVELYGERKERDGWQWSGLKGPFYCGLSTVMPIPEFELRLYGPTSTSLAIETATNFAGKDGIVIQLNNKVRYHKYLSGFRCSWISGFTEEDEMLFMGGRYRIAIESVRILSGKGGHCQNFEYIFGALCKFNKMFNGDCADKRMISDDETITIINLIHWISNKDAKHNFDIYILDTFRCFAEQKRHIVFNYYTLFKRNDQALLDTVFYGMKGGYDLKHTEFWTEKINIFRKDLFQVFKNAERIDIHTTDYNGHGQCGFSLRQLLSEIENEQWSEVRVYAVHYKANGAWIGGVWLTEAEELTEKYRIAFRNETNKEGKIVDCVVIKK
eukprot:62726_1